MKYRRLGKTNLKVSIIGLGTWQFGGEWGKDFTQPEVDEMFDAARQCGINFIDTAECYGDHTSESFIGSAIAKDRANWIVATKFGHKFHGYMNRTDERTSADALVQVEASLKALKTDYIDLLQYHSVRFEEFDNDELSAVLDDFVKSGKSFAYVITVCDEASAERCPIFPGVTRRLQWSFPDPSSFQGSREEKLAGTRKIRDAIKAKIESWCTEVCTAECA